MSLIECVPNFSEGRDQETIRAIVDAAEGVHGVRVLDVSSDAWHHRSVVTMAGPLDAIGDAAFAALREACHRIDLNAHRGEHPRMGATDVVPFVPLEGASMEDCVALARALGARVGNELEIPVFLYERAATREAMRDLARIRRGGFEELRERIGSDPDGVPDFGPARVHPTAGAVAIGARALLVAFNVFLGDARRIDAAQEIARSVRGSSGGLPGVKALAFVVDGQAQLSMNLTDLDATPPHVVYETVVLEASRRGLAPKRSELVGLAPGRVFQAAGVHFLGLPASSGNQQLEARLRATGLARGGGRDVPISHQPAVQSTSAGGAAALGGALAASLAERLALRSSTLTADTHSARAAALRVRLEELARLDDEAYQALLAAEALPLQVSAADGGTRDAVLTAALVGASGVPLETARCAADIAAIAVESAATVATGSHDAADALAVAYLADASCRTACWLVRVNVGRLPDPTSARGMVQAAEEFARVTTRAVEELTRPA